MGTFPTGEDRDEQSCARLDDGDSVGTFSGFAKRCRDMTQFHSKSDYFRRLLLVLDVSLIVFCFVAVLQVYAALRPEQQIDKLAHVWIVIVFVGVFWASRKILGKDVGLGRPNIGSEMIGLIREFLISLSIVFGMIFVFKFEFVSRAVLIGFSISSFTSLIVVRWFLFWWYFGRSSSDPENFVNVLIIGSGRRAHALADRLSNKLEFGVNIVGFLDPKGQSAGRRGERRNSRPCRKNQRYPARLGGG